MGSAGTRCIGRRIQKGVTSSSVCPGGVASNSESWMRPQSGLGLVVAAKLVLGEPFRERGRDLEFPPLFLVW